jgi:hypothetical protein
MTFLGKILVFVNLVLSLCFAIWAFALYTNRIDWTTTKGTDRPGEYARRDTEMQGLKAALTRGEAGVDVANRSVQAEEERIPKYVAWYKDQLDKLRAGKDPVQALVMSGGVVALDAEGYPKLGPVLSASKQPIGGLASLAVLNQEYAAKHQAYIDTTHELDKVLDAERLLTEQIGNGKDKGLRAQLAAVELAGKNSVDEQEFIKPLLYNREVEGQLLVKRGQALQARLKELESVSVATKP